MAKWQVRIGVSQFTVDARDRQDAKLKAARLYVRKYPNANVSTHKLLTQYKIKASALGDKK